MKPRIELLKDLIIETIQDDNYLISSFYQPIQSNDSIDRWVEQMYQLVDEANDTNKKCWGILTQTNNGEISYLTEDYASYSFDFDLTLHTIVDFKDEIFEKVDTIIEELSKKTNIINGYSIILTFSNPNLSMPYIHNKDELVEIRLEGSCFICKGNLLTARDILDTTISIPSQNIYDVKVPTKENVNKYSIVEENRQTKPTKYYTETLTTRVGIQAQLEILVDLNNPVCLLLLDFANKRLDDPNIEIIITKKYRDNVTFASKRIISDVSEGYTTSGILVLTISFYQNEDIK